MGLIDEKTPENSKEVLDKIRKKEIIDYNNYRITGDIKIDKSILEMGQLESQITIKDSHIEGELYIEDIVFFGNIQFERTTFSGPVTIKNCRIDPGSRPSEPTFSFINCKFEKKILFDHIVFTHFLLKDSKIKRDVKFEHILFEKTANFHKTCFNGQIHVTDCYFTLYANFDGVVFGDVANFVRTTFKYATFFQKYVDKNKKVHFCIFKKRAIFNEVTFHEETVFDEAQFLDELIFKKSNFLYTLSLKGTCIMFLKDREIAYRKAKKASEDHGFYSDATHYYIDEMKAIREQKPWYIRIPELVLFDWFLGYGVKPERIIISWVGIVVLFAIGVYASKGISGVNGGDLINDWVNSLEFSIMRATTPGVIGFQVNDNFKIFAFIEALIGTYFWAGIIACIGKKFLRV